MCSYAHEVSVKLSLFAGVKDNTPQLHETTWAQFAADLGPHATEFTEKLSVPAFSPAVFSGPRAKTNVTEIHFGVLDIDKPSSAEVDELCGRVEPYQHILYSTWSHSPDRFCARLLVPFDRPVGPEEWARVWQHLDRSFGGFGDPACKDPSRLYFIPACPNENGQDAFYFCETEGKVFEVPRNAIPESNNKQISTKQLRALAGGLKRSKSAYKNDLGMRLSKMIDGEPFAEEGERDDIIYKLTATITDRYPNIDAESLSDLFGNSLKLMGLDGPTVEDVQKKIDRHKAPRIAEQKQALDAAGRQPYTDEEIIEFAKQQNTKPELFSWLIQKGKAYYVFFDGTYLGPYLAEELVLKVKKYLEPLAPVTSTKMGSRDVIDKKPLDLMLDYGEIADKVVADLSATEARFDFQTKTMHEAPCPLDQTLTPQYDVQVAEWLEALAGPEREQELLQWLSVVTRLEEPCAALYLGGPPGAGKTLLADGLAKLWNREPVDLESAMGSFNNELVRCPLILADEAIPCDWRGRPRTTELRQFVQNRTHTIKRKYLPEVQAYGSTRLIITSNNRELLTSGENLTANDIQAIVDRLIYIQCRKEAVEYLQALGNQTVRTFVKDNRIARHALWLRGNIEIERGSRFLVTGSDSALHRTMTTSTGLRADLCNWLVDYLLTPTRYPGDDLLVRRYKGELLVNVRGLVKHWRIYEDRDQVPRTSRLSSALSGLSNGRVKLVAGDGRPTQYHRVDAMNLFTWAADSGYASPEILRAALTTDS